MLLDAKQTVRFRKAYAKEYGEILNMTDAGIAEIIGPVEGDAKNVALALSAVAAFQARNKMMEEAAEEAEEEADTRELLDASLAYGTDQTPIRVRDFVVAIDANEALLDHLEDKANIDVRRKVIDLETMDHLVGAYGSEKMSNLPWPNTIGPGVKRKGRETTNRPAIIMVPGEKRAHPEDFYIEAVRATRKGRDIENAIGKIEKSVTKKDELTFNQRADVNTLKTRLTSRIQTVKKAVSCFLQFDALSELDTHIAVECRKVDADGERVSVKWIADGDGLQWERTTYPVVIGKLPLSLGSQEKRNLSTNDFARLDLAKARAFVANRTHKHIFEALVETLKRQQQEGVMKLTEKNIRKAMLGFVSFARSESGGELMFQYATAKDADVRGNFRKIVKTMLRQLTNIERMIDNADALRAVESDDDTKKEATAS